jgi:hypothetical protein
MTAPLMSVPYSLLRARMAIPATVVVVLIALGIFHGSWTDRWEKAVDQSVLTERLQRIPLIIGDWDGRDEGETVPPEFVETVGRVMVKRYVHRKSGEVVKIFVTGGRTGPVLVNHPPTQCFTALGFKATSEPTRYAVPLEASSAEFLTTVFQKMDGPAPIYQRVLWSFSGSGEWQVPKSPRIAFARFPSIYKLYVIRLLRKPNEPLEDDPANEFIRVLVAELRKTLFAEA